MMKLVSPSEWEQIERALMKAEIPYKVTFDSHIINDEDVVYDTIINIDVFKMQTLRLKKEDA